jgi:hypothetical protein
MHSSTLNVQALTAFQMHAALRIGTPLGAFALTPPIFVGFDAITFRIPAGIGIALSRGVMNCTPFLEEL